MIRPIIAVDPGTQCTGFAVFHNNSLLDAGVFEPEVDGDAHAFGLLMRRLTPRTGAWPPRLVVEQPHEQVRRARTDDLIKLALWAGACAGAAQSAFGGCWLEYVRPSAWKGGTQKPKRARDEYVVERRVLEALDVVESEIVKRAKPRSRRKQFDMFDAVGLGLCAAGRVGRGVTRI